MNKLIVFMKYSLPLFLGLFLLSACNQDEGLGGSSSLEGYVYQIEHSDDNFSFQTDTFPAVKKDVYLIFGDNATDYFGDDVETDNHGLYRFDYLRKGNYIVYSYSEYPDGRKAAISQNVKVGGGANKADTLFIHTGKSYGTSMIKGCVYALFYDKTTKIDEGWAIDTDVYINRAGEEMFFDRIRVGDQGIFIFQKILPGKYEIWVTSEDPETRKLTPVKKEIEVTKPETLYEFPERFTIKVRA
ncbi:MAG: hypothetical protein LBC48_04745 [Dysgonamonadaceae bacterium]|jgi:hypothetical protein|nr:hypothetical protein [Dysgonamonadaceae bacterium]